MLQIIFPYSPLTRALHDMGKVGEPTTQIGRTYASEKAPLVSSTRDYAEPCAYQMPEMDATQNSVSRMLTLMSSERSMSSLDAGPR
jgi:hypothetical protein